MTTSVLLVLGRSAGGIARHVAGIAAALEEDDRFRIDVAGPVDLPVSMPKPILEVSIPDGPIRGHRRAASRLRRLIAEGRYDVVHAHGLRAGIDSARAARPLDVPVLVTVHNLVMPEIAGRLKAPFYRWAERIVVRSCDRVFCVSEQIASHLRKLVPAAAGRIEVTYLGIDEPPAARRSAAEIRRDLGIDETRKLIVTASRLSAQKALPVMFEAVSSIEDAHLAVLGEGPLEAELRALAQRKLGSRVTFLGFRDDVVDHIRAADVFCLSSVWEGVPLAAQEAILVGTPVVATNVGGMSELIDDGVSGRLVAKDEPESLAAALREVLDSRALARRYTEAASDNLRRRFSRESMQGFLRTAYEEAAGAS